MKAKRILATVLALGLLITLMVGATLAQEGPQEASSPQDANGISIEFTYQGRLTDGGSPANGTYDFRFNLYDTATGNGQVGSADLVEDQAVSDGLFTVAAPYALALKPGAEIVGSSVYGTGLVVENTDSAIGYGLLGMTNASSAGAGVTGSAKASSGPASGVRGFASSASGYAGYFSNDAGGVDLMAAGSGVIKSTADSILYLSPHDMVVRGSSGVDLTYREDGGVDIHSSTSGTRYLSIPVSTFGTLFGSSLYVKGIEVCYHRVGSGFIQITMVAKNDGSDGGYTPYIFDTTTRNSEAYSCYSVTDPSPLAIDNASWVQFNVNGGDHVIIHSVKLTLTEMP
ncbi:MAG: hypothetical protein P8129_16130 [Anaerolineae bacterium]